MASVTMSAYGTWNSANRSISVTASANDGDTSVRFDISSTYTWSMGTYTRIRVATNKDSYDTGYCSNFNAFPCAKNSSKTVWLACDAHGNVPVSLGCGISHNNVTDKTDSGTIDRTPAPSNVSINPVAGRTSINLNRTWSNATSCQYNIAGWGWIDEYTSYPNGVHVSGNNVTNLTPNTSYSCQVRFYNSGKGPTYSNTATVTTTGNPPVINSVTPAPARTTCSLASNSISYDTNASFASVRVQYGTSASYGSTATSTSLSNLQPNTTYYFSMTVTDNWGRISGAKTGSFTTTCNAPSNLSITRASATTSSIDVKLNATGDTNAPITNYTLYYRKGTSGSYSSIDYGTNTQKTISGLDSDTNYQFYFTATNAGGTSTSSVVTLSPNLNNPTISAFVITDLLPFTCTATVTASVSPTRTLNYRFSKDGGTTWTSYQASNVYNWTGLNEETTYTMAVQVKAIHTSQNASDTTATTSVTIKTPADQAKIRRMINGQWIKGKTYIKVNGSWVKAKKLYIKVNGEWKLNDNEH